MTCIAIIKNKRGKLVMAGDRRVTHEDGQYHTLPDTNPKIKKDKKTGILIGISGDDALCNIFLRNLKIPDVTVSDPDLYIHQIYKEKLFKTLQAQKYSDGLSLRIPADDHGVALIGIEGRCYQIEITNSSGVGVIKIDEVSVPYAIGCGAAYALAILYSERKKAGYSTKEHLTLAIETSADLSCGVDKNIDYLQED